MNSNDDNRPTPVQAYQGDLALRRNRAVGTADIGDPADTSSGIFVETMHGYVDGFVPFSGRTQP
ncbi:hypothetical protein [Corynebacterium glyciniphilum]|uniref:hypothetical protein n=1 Tax=Corynebacterium glyciniphilum TaxID=1404244 RepID=UPI003FD3B269